VAAFDHLYTAPLFRLRALLRSTTITFVVWLIYFLVITSIITKLSHPDYIAFDIAFVIIFSAAILSDYISLFVVHKSAIFSRDHPLFSIVLSVCFGILTIILANTITIAIVILAMFIYFGWQHFELPAYWEFCVETLGTLTTHPNRLYW
jgi:hypothetical protein